MIEILIKPSKKADKKYDAVIDGKKTVSFGSSQHSDFTKHKDDGRMLLYIMVIAYIIISSFINYLRVDFSFKARDKVENIIKSLLLLCSTIAIITTVGIIMSVIVEANRFFSTVSIFEFLFDIK